MTFKKGSQAQIDWTKGLLAEAERDLIFLWNITNGNYGGPKEIPTADLPDVLECMVGELVAGGCVVGHGDPDACTWYIPEELVLEPGQMPKKIRELWLKNEEDYDWLVFAKR